VQQTTTLQNNQQNDYLEKVSNKLSIYGKGEVTTECLAKGKKIIKASKPELPNGWYDVLDYMIEENGFTDQRFIDAVEVMITTCVYPKPSHADILSYDKFIDAYTWEELLDNVRNASPEYRGKYLQSFVRIIHYGEERWCKREDATKYKLELWKPPIRLATKEELNPSEEIESGETENLSLSDLVKSMKQPPDFNNLGVNKKLIKKLSLQEREKRRKKFEAILETKKGEIK